MVGRGAYYPPVVELSGWVGYTIHAARWILPARRLRSGGSSCMRRRSSSAGSFLNASFSSTSSILGCIHRFSGHGLTCFIVVHLTSVVGLALYWGCSCGGEAGLGARNSGLLIPPTELGLIRELRLYGRRVVIVMGFWC